LTVPAISSEAISGARANSSTAYLFSNSSQFQKTQIQHIQIKTLKNLPNFNSNNQRFHNFSQKSSKWQKRPDKLQDSSKANRQHPDKKSKDIPKKNTNKLSPPNFLPPNPPPVLINHGLARN
jgi:hypothetical protein